MIVEVLGIFVAVFGIMSQYRSGEGGNFVFAQDMGGGGGDCCFDPGPAPDEGHYDAPPAAEGPPTLDEGPPPSDDGKGDFAPPEGVEPTDGGDFSKADFGHDPGNFGGEPVQFFEVETSIPAWETSSRRAPAGNSTLS